MKKKRIIIAGIKIIIILALIILVKEQSYSGSWESIGNFASYEQKGNIITFSCEKNIVIRLEVCSPGMFRVRLSPKGKFTDKPEYIVVKHNWPDINYTVVDEKDRIVIKTDKITIKASKTPFRLSVYDKEDRLICQEYKKGMGWSKNGIQGKMVLSSSEHFFGLGEQFGKLSHRGQKVPLWSIKTEREEARWGLAGNGTYVPVPFFLSTNGYGIFVNTTYRSIYDFGKTSSKWYSFEVEDNQLDYYFIYGYSFKDIIKQYTELTGRSPLPPKWAFGLWSARYPQEGQKKLVEICKKYRSKDIPCDVISLDYPWATGGTGGISFEWNAALFPEPAEVISKIHNMNLKLCLIEKNELFPGCAAYNEANDLGYLVKNGGSLLDFTNPAASIWWGDKHKSLMSQGADVFKPDHGEGQYIPEESTFYNGMSRAGMYNVYSLLYNKSVFNATKEYRESIGKGRGIVWARSGYAGSQRYPVIWTGDWEAIFEDLQVTIRAGQSIGLSGFPFWGHDIGGIEGWPSDKCYIRWAQFGLFSPLSRLLGWGQRDPWLFKSNAEQIFRTYDKLRYRLLPYIYTYAWIAHQTGVPIMRAMVLEYQDDPEGYDKDFQYFFGKELLVAPIYTKSNKRKIYFPEGVWIDYWTGEKYTGPKNISYSAPLDRLPLFVKAGAIIPMGPEMDYVDEKLCDPLTLDIYPSGRSSFALYEDDGITGEYEKDAYALTTFGCLATEKRIVITTGEAVGEYETMIRARTYILKINNCFRPKHVIRGEKAIDYYKTYGKLENVKVGWWYDSSKRICIVKVPSRVTYGSITLELK